MDAATTLRDQLANFTGALDDLNATLITLKTLPESEARTRHEMRIIWALNQVATVQTIAIQITMATTGLKRTTKLAMPKAALDTAIYALKGGTALLAGVDYAAKQFIHAEQNPNLPPLALGLLTGANWASLGELLGSIEGLRR